MKRKSLIILFLLSTVFLYGQKFEVGFALGGSNYIGDVGSTFYINPNSLLMGGVFKWNISKRYAYKATFSLTTLRGADRDSNNSARAERNFDFENTANEVSVGMEFNFLEYDLDYFSRSVTPYIFGGISYLMHDELYFIKPSDNSASIYDRGSTFALPMALGIKGHIGPKLSLGFEIGVRYAFDDNIDGSDPDTGVAENDNLRFGNLYSDDWYTFSVFTLTYAIGKEPCTTCFSNDN